MLAVHGVDGGAPFDGCVCALNAVTSLLTSANASAAVPPFESDMLATA